MDSQAKQREDAYQRWLGEKGFTTGTAVNHTAYTQTHLPQIAKEQQYDADIRSTFGPSPAPAIDVSWSSNPAAGSSLPMGETHPYGSAGRTSHSTADYPAPAIVIAIRIMLGLIVLGGVGGGLWAWATDYPHPIATGFSSAWLVVRVYLSVVLFLISQLVLVGIEVCVVMWPYMKDLIAHITELSLPWAAAAGSAVFGVLLAIIYGVRKLLLFVRPGFRFLALLVATAGGLTALDPGWWSAHMAATVSVISWSEANISWLVVTREVLTYFAAS